MRAVNLIPAEQRTGQSVGAGRSQGGVYAVLFVVAGLALMVYLYGSADHQIASRKAQISSLNAQAQQAQSAAERLAPYTSFIALREQRTQAVQTLIDSRFDWAHVFHEFGRVLPPGVSIASLGGTVGSAGTTASAPASSAAGASASGASVSSATPPGSVPTFTLTGCATNQPTVALLLQRLRLIDGAASVMLQSSTAAGGPASSSSSGGACPANGPVFSVQMSFDPLPSTAAELSAIEPGAKVVSDARSSASSSALSTATGTSLR